MHSVIGIDEVGRGPLAGPVVIGAVRIPAGADLAILAAARDSKQMSPGAREELFEHARRERTRGSISVVFSRANPRTIDTRGISSCLHRCVASALARLAPDPSELIVLLDGALRAPEHYRQETIIRGDSSEPAIALASVLAKVHRDRYMTRIAARYPHYGFERHKGYGTPEHYAAIARHGLCDIHRRTFYRPR